MTKQEPETIVLNRFVLMKEEWIEKLAANWKTALFIGLGVLALIVSLIQFAGKARSSLFADSFALEQSLSAWEASGFKDGEALSKIEKALSRHADFQAKAGAQVAQKLLALKEIKRAIPYTEKTLRRVPFPTAYHRRFAQNAVQIGKGEYAAALTEAKELKKDLENDSALWSKQGEGAHYGSILYAFNLLRVASLETVAGTPERALAVWKELEEQLVKAQFAPATLAINPEGYYLLEQNFTQNDLTLRAYIQHQKAVLSQRTKSS